MRKASRISTVFTAVAMMLSFFPTSSIFAADSKPAKIDSSVAYSMNLSDYAGEWEYREDSNCYALIGVVYCTNPVNAAYERMDIYVPAVYMDAAGALTDKVLNGYTAETAPIIYENEVGGYSEATPYDLQKPAENPDPKVFNPGIWKYPQFCHYLAKGYVVVSPGSRGRQTQTADGTFVGKSPAGLVDLKAGVRFLKYNDNILAGDSNKIVSVGGSAGGAMSALLGATGNAADYLPYLNQIGAIMTVGDNVYGAMCRCPITDLENASMAYEWMFQGDNHYSFMGKSGMLTAFQQALSADLAAEFPKYVRGLSLDPDGDSTPLSLTRDKNGNYYSGTYHDYLLAKIEEALADYLTRTYSKTSGGMPSYTYIDKDSVEKYIAELNQDAKGNALKTPWVSVGYDTKSVTTGSNQLPNYNVIGKVTITSLDVFIKNYRSRGKMCTAFDDLTLGQPENQEFGSETADATHFDTTVAGLLKRNADKYAACTKTPGSQYNYSASLANAYAEANDAEVVNRVALLNPMNYIGNAEKKSDTAPFFRIRVGTKDEHTSFTVALNLALALETYTTSTVDYAMIWNKGHGNSDYEADFLTWMERIGKTEATPTGEQTSASLTP